MRLNEDWITEENWKNWAITLKKIAEKERKTKAKTISFIVAISVTVLLSVVYIFGVLGVNSTTSTTTVSNTVITQQDDENSEYRVDAKGRIIVSYGFFEKAKSEAGIFGISESISDDESQLTFHMDGNEYVVKNLTSEQRVNAKEMIDESYNGGLQYLVISIAISLFGASVWVATYILYQRIDGYLFKRRFDF